MAVTLKSTSQVQSNGVKALVYGQSKAGKTTLIGTLKNQLIISAESGLLSLAGTDIPYIEVKTVAELREAYEFALNSDFETICLDSISEIAEICLCEEKGKTKDGRAIYGNMQDAISKEIRNFRDMPGKNVFFIAKMEFIEIDGKFIYRPLMPGKQLGNLLAYNFDLVMPLRVEKADDGAPFRVLMTEPDGTWTAGCRNGYLLSTFEQPDLGAIIQKIKGVSK